MIMLFLRPVDSTAPTSLNCVYQVISSLQVTHISGVFDLFFPEKNSGSDLFSMAWMLL